MNQGSVVVVGGGPIGLAAAIEARLAGFECTVVEQRQSPIDKACGEGLMPGAVTALERLGVIATGQELRGIEYTDGERSVEHRFANRCGLGIRRTALLKQLDDRAREVGVKRIEGKATALSQDATGVTLSLQGRTGGHPSDGPEVSEAEQVPRSAELGEIRAQWVVAADGLHSTVRRLAGLDGLPQRQARRRFGIRRHFAIEPWTDLVEVHWGRGVELYVTPVAPDTVGIAMLGPAQVDFAQALAGFPSLWSRVRHADPASALRGAGPLRQTSRRRRAGRVLLAGDASGYVDALTGEGLRVGFAQARVAIASIVANRPDLYERAWSRATRDFRVLTSGLVFAAGTPLRSRIVPAACGAPRLFGAIVERLAQ